MIVTVHARERWIERVDPSATLDQAAAAIRSHARALAAAEKFPGCEVDVILPNRHRLRVCDGAVVTVI